MFSYNGVVDSVQLPSFFNGLVQIPKSLVSETSSPHFALGSQVGLCWFSVKFTCMFSPVPSVGTFSGITTMSYNANYARHNGYPIYMF